MTYGDMHWQQRLSLMNAPGFDPGTGDSSGFNPGMALDTATMPWSGATQEQQKQLQKLRDQLQLAQDMNATPGGTMTKDIFKFLKGVGEVVSIGDPVFKALAWPYRKLSTDFLSPVAHMASLSFNRDWQNQIGDSNPFTAFWDWDTWHRADKLAEKESIGTEYMRLAMMTGTWAAHPSKFGTWSDAKEKEYTAPGAMSGTVDAFSTFFLDPLMVFGKVAKVGRVLKTTTNASRVVQRSGGDFDDIMAREPIQRFMRWTEGKSAYEISEHEYIKHSPQAGQIADLMAHSTWGDKNLIYRIGHGDQAAYNQLMQQAPDVLANYNRLKGNQKFLSSQLRGKRANEVALRAQIMEQSQGIIDHYGDANRTMLKLAATEQFTDPMKYADPAAATVARSPFHQMYDNAGVTLFGSSTWRPPVEAAAGIQHLEDMTRRAAILADGGAFPTGKAAAKMPTLAQMSRGVKNPAGDVGRRELVGNKTGSAYKAKESRYATVKIRFYSSDELAMAERTGRTRVPMGAEFTKSGTRRVRQPDGTYKQVLDPTRDKAITVGKATQTDLLSGMVDEAGTPINTVGKLAGMASKPPVELPPVSLNRYPLYNYNPAAVAEHAEAMKGQLDLADYELGGELRALESKWGFYKELSDKADTLAHLPGTSGIFGQLSLMPKTGGAFDTALGEKVSAGYSRIAEGRAARRFNKSSNFTRRGFGEEIRAGNNVSVRRYGWFNTPVKVVMASGRHMGRAIQDTGTPHAYNPNNPEAWRTVDQWLKKVKGYDPAARISHVNALMGMVDETEKLDHVRKIEADVLKHMMLRNGIEDDLQLQQTIAKTMGKRQAVMDQMADQVRTYKAGNTDLKVNWLDEDGTPTVIHPLLATQLVNEHPLMPVDDLERAFHRNRHWMRSKHVALKDPVMDLSTMAHRAWKLSVLGHFGYMPRTLSDEVLVATAALGAIGMTSKGVEGMYNYMRNLPTHSGNLLKRAGNVPAKLSRDPLKYEYKTPKHRIGEGNTRLSPNVEARGIFAGSRGDIYRGLTGVQQRAAFELEAKSLEHLRTGSNWGELDPKNTQSHIKAWVHALNNQLGRDELAGKLLQGWSHADVLEWLTRHPRGLQYAGRNKLMASNKEDWVRNLQHFVNEYTVGDPKLAKKAAKRHVTQADLLAIPEKSRPQVHGGEIDYAMGTGTFRGFMNDVMDNFYHVMNALPTDTLVRHPVADLYYHKRLRELVASSRAQGLDPRLEPARLYQMEEIARQWSIKQMHGLFKDHLFNSPQSALKFVFPFFGAWRGSLARWANMIGEDPSVLARANQGWQGLGKGFEIQDADGNTLDPNDPRGLGSNAQMVVRLPKWATRALGYSGVAPARRINLRTFNTILQGDPWYNPGYGPVVTIPLSQTIKGDVPGLGGPKPYLAENPLVKQALPYGARSAFELSAPAPWQRVLSAFSGENESNATMDSTKINIMKMEMTRWSRGERSNRPTAEEVNSKASHLMWLRAAESWFSPVSTKPVIYSDKWPKGWQFLADKFRQYRSSTPNEEGRIDGKAGEDKFFQEFPEAWIYMKNTSKNPSGIPANFSSWDKSQRVKDFMGKAPDIFASVANIRWWDKDGFDRGVYDAQMSQPFNPETGENMRETGSPHSFIADASVSEGWRRYAKMMDTIRVIEDQRGIDPVFGTTPDDLGEFKRNYVANLRQKFPEWGDQYDGGSSTGRMRNILEQANTVLGDKRLMADKSRTDLRMLQNYVTTRAWMAQQLQQRNAAGGSAVLGANSNSDLQQAWTSVRNWMGQDTTFSELWLDRYFANDYLQEVK